MPVWATSGVWAKKVVRVSGAIECRTDAVAIWVGSCGAAGVGSAELAWAVRARRASASAILALISACFLV